MNHFLSIYNVHGACVSSYRVTPNLLNPVENLPSENQSPAVQLAIKIRGVGAILKTMALATEYEPALQDLFQWGHEHRRTFSKSDWDWIQSAMLNPFQTHLANFIRESDALSPNHWYRFNDDPENSRPENPTLQIRVGEIRSPLGNFALQKPTDGFLFPGLGVTFDGVQIVLTPLSDKILEIDGIFARAGVEVPMAPEAKAFVHQNGNRHEIQIDVRKVWYEIPYTVSYPVKILSHDQHAFALARQSIQPKQKGKYVVVRNRDQEYSARFGATHHFQMIGPDDILIAGGWLGMRPHEPASTPRKSKGSLSINLQTARFGHLMRDPLSGKRLILAAEILTQFNYSAGYTPGDPYGDIDRHL